MGECESELKGVAAFCTYGVERAEALVLDDATGDTEGTSGGAELEAHLHEAPEWGGGEGGRSRERKESVKNGREEERGSRHKKHTRAGVGSVRTFCGGGASTPHNVS